MENTKISTKKWASCNSSKFVGHELPPWLDSPRSIPVRTYYVSSCKINVKFTIWTSGSRKKWLFYQVHVAYIQYAIRMSELLELNEHKLLFIRLCRNPFYSIERVNLFQIILERTCDCLYNTFFCPKNSQEFVIYRVGALTFYSARIPNTLGPALVL